MSKKRPALGRGLGALIPTRPAPVEPPPVPSTSDVGAGPRKLPIERLRPNPEQPRKRFDVAELEQLAASIRAQGIVQPIVVTPRVGAPGEFFIVAGERRWRAAQLAGIHDVPIVVREADEDHERLELALVENLQRADLNPIEEGRALKRLMDLRGYTHEQLGQRVGKDRSTITNAMRMLRLPEKVQDMVREGQLSMGHARALLGLEHEDDMLALAREAVRTSMSVRATERAVRQRLKGPGEPEDEDSRKRTIIVGELEDRLRKTLGARVRLRARAGERGAGTIEIPYGTLDELDRLLNLLLDGRED